MKSHRVKPGMTANRHFLNDYNGVDLHPEPPHDSAQRGLSGPYQQVEMIWNQGPCITPCLRFFQNLSKSCQEILPIRIIDKYHSPFDPSGHDMLQNTGCIQSGLTGHRLKLNFLTLFLLYRVLELQYRKVQLNRCFCFARLQVVIKDARDQFSALLHECFLVRFILNNR